MEESLLTQTKEAFVFCAGYKADIKDYIFIATTYGKEHAEDIIKFCYKNSVEVKEFMLMYKQWQEKEEIIESLIDANAVDEAESEDSDNKTEEETVEEKKE